MSCLQRRTAAVIDMRLVAITDTAADLKAQLCELNRLATGSVKHNYRPEHHGA
jgi:hypothetical protein